MLASSSQEANASCGRRWQESPSHRGERAISRKAIAQGRPDALRWTCMLMRALLVHIAHETAGAARTRSSLRPLFTEGGKFLAKLGRNASRDCGGVFWMMPTHTRSSFRDAPLRAGP